MADNKLSLIVPGVRAMGAVPEPQVQQYLKLDSVQSFDIAAARRGEGAPESLVEGPPDSIVKVEYESGLVEYLRLDQFRSELGVTREAGPVRVPTSLERGAIAGRGPSEWVLKALHVFGVSPSEIIASETAEAVVAHFDSKRADALGLFRMAADGSFVSESRNKAVPASPQPYLVFIHGTASSTEGSFGGFWNMKTKQPTAEWKDLGRKYEDRILALEHATFSVSPAQNTLDLLRLLPDNATLHVITHSRGGLVGELLGLGTLEADQLAAFKGRPDQDLLNELSKLLADKKPKVEKFVRTACPAAGTILASKRIDIYLNLILNAIGLVPGLAENPFYELFKATAIELIKLRADPYRIPGIEAQMPESPFIHLLNTHGRQSDADLGVIAGDFEGSGVGGTLATYALRAYFWEQNDFVVNTRSMSGGMDRKRPVRRFFDQGGTVNHFSYFKNASSRSKITDWLYAAPGAPVQGFDQVRGAKAPPTGTRGSATLPLAVVVPDVFGTHLTGPEGDDLVWLNYSELGQGAFTSLRWQGQPHKPGDLLPAYEPLLQQLSLSHEVLAFGYDWRQRIEDSARLLDAAVQKSRGTGRTVRFIGHGAGGLVVLAMSRLLGAGKWDALTAGGGGLWMLGSPTRGSWRIARLLAGRGRLSRMLALLGRHTDAEVVGILQGFPGLVDLLPETMLNAGSWNEVRLGRPTVELLTASKQWRDSFQPEAASRIVYIAGSAPATPDGLDGYTEEGDGNVTYALGGATVRTDGKPKIDWYNPDAAHGDLVAKPGPLLQLITAGITAAYDSSPHPRAGTLDKERLAARDEAVFFPSENDLADVALGRGEKVEAAGESLMTVRVTHGHVRMAKFPVAVGHYRDDGIVSAEAQIDRQLQNRLSTRFQMDLYPGPEGTVEVVRAPACSPPGALVIGLGDVGEVTADKVRRGVLEACLKYALMRSEDSDASADGPRSAAISSMLIGVSGGRAISIADSINAIVRGAVEANRVLRRRNLIDKVRIDQIEFVEIFEDAAIEAVHAAAGLKDSLRNALEAGERVEFDCRLRSLPSGLARRALSQYATGWWRRILVTGENGDDAVACLSFENLTDRARSEQTTTDSQTALVNTLLENVTRQSTFDESSAVTLFELLVPNALKDQAPDAADLVLVLDALAARYPWELMAERARDQIAPLSVRMGMLRQLKSADFRPQPRGVRDHHALVIGDPLVAETLNPEWPPLPGARDEAREVTDVLTRNGYTATSLIREGSAAIIRQLFAHDYRILHLAGHGDYNEKLAHRSGMVLKKDPKNPAADVYLTSMELRQIRTVPDLVFINCCHLGNIDRPLGFPAHRLAASIAEELIDMGVKAVVAAGWAVDDTAATVFASSFYRSMLAGKKFGESVKVARQDAFNLGRNNTWGAYQCYGNPDFALLPPSGGDGPPKRGFCVRRECLDELNDIAASSEGASSEEVELLKSRTDAVDRALKSYWRDGESLFRLAEAHKSMSDFKRAIPLYREAVRQEKSSAPIAAIEQLANVLDRYAATIWDSEPDRAGELWNEAAGRLEKLGLLLDEGGQKNTERLSLLGALYKRRRDVDPKVEREYLKKSTEYYSEAYEYVRDRLGQADIYAGLNAIAAAWLGRHPIPDFADACIKEAKRGRDADDFWGRVGCADALLLEYLTQSTLPGHENEVILAYRDAFQHARPNQRDSALKQVQLLHDRRLAAIDRAAAAGDSDDAAVDRTGVVGDPGDPAARTSLKNILDALQGG